MDLAKLAGLLSSEAIAYMDQASIDLAWGQYQGNTACWTPEHHTQVTRIKNAIAALQAFKSNGTEARARAFLNKLSRPAVLLSWRVVGEGEAHATLFTFQGFYEARARVANGKTQVTSLSAITIETAAFYYVVGNGNRSLNIHTYLHTELRKLSAEWQ